MLWTEWNGKYRDYVRRFWKGDGGTASEFATRLAGSSDLYQDDGRKPYASINFITCHDGFTLQDLVSYNDKHNEANGEDNRDGANDNNSWNCGAEGPTDDPAIIELRERQKRNLMATLMLSSGRADDARRRRARPHPEGQQQRLLPGQRADLARLGARRPRRSSSWNSSSKLIVHLEEPAGLPAPEVLPWAGRSAARTIKDISFFDPSGSEMSDEDWNAGFVKCLGVRLAGDLIDDVDERGEPIVGETLLILLNAHWEPIPFTLPATQRGPHLGAHPGHGRHERGAAGLTRGARNIRSRTARWSSWPPASPQHTGHTATPEQVRAVLERQADPRRPRPSRRSARRGLAG